MYATRTFSLVIGLMAVTTKPSQLGTSKVACRWAFKISTHYAQRRTQEFFRRGVQQIQLRAESRVIGDHGGGGPLVRSSTNLQMSETRILIRLLRMYFPRN
jgi:hypothetical protein